jgi:hypothetical protein
MAFPVRKLKPFGEEILPVLNVCLGDNKIAIKQ